MNDVLFVGPDYQQHRGGIGAVLETYSANIKPFKFIPTYNNKSALSRNLLFVKAMGRITVTLIRDRDIEFVHIHTASKGSFLRKSIVLMVAKLFRKKAILHVHGAMFHTFYEKAGILRPYVRSIFRRADAVIVLSKTWKDYFSANFKIKKLFILNNVIERPQQPKKPRAAGAVKLLFLGIIGDRKGIFDLLRVMSINKELFAEKLFLTIGGNGETERLIKTIKDYGLEEQVDFVGWVSGPEKNKLLDDCDIYILPSYNEGLPISVLEAMAHGKPVISTTTGGIPEIVHDGYNGWLFNPGDLLKLKSVLWEAVSRTELLNIYGTRSYWMAEKYTPEAVMGSLRDLYLQIK